MRGRRRGVMALVQRLGTARRHDMLTSRAGKELGLGRWIVFAAGSTSRWRGLVQVAVHVGVVSRLRRGSRKTDAMGMLAAWSRRWCCRGAAEVP